MKEQEDGDREEEDNFFFLKPFFGVEYTNDSASYFLTGIYFEDNLGELFEGNKSKFFFTPSFGVGIYDDGSGDMSIEANTFRNSEYGTYMYSTIFFTIEDNTFRNDRIREMLGIGIGIALNGAIHGSVTNNEISGFDIAGIVYQSVSYIETKNNEIYDNGKMLSYDRLCIFSNLFPPFLGTR